MRLLFAALAALALVCPQIASAATCNATAGVQQWNTLTGLASDCGTEAVTDVFVIDDGDTVILNFAGPAFTGSTGAIRVQTGGTLIITPGNGPTWAGATDGYLSIEGGTLVMEGSVLWQGRISGDVTCTDGSPDTCALPLPSDVSQVAATTDYVVIGDDDPSDGTVRAEPQTNEGEPSGGKYRPSYSRLVWYPISSLSSTAATIISNAYEGETLADANVYEGTRGPAREAATALTENVKIPGGHESQIAVAAAAYAVPMTGDLGSQYVRFEDGACAGQHFKVTGTTADTGDDSIFVAGDTSGCGATPNVTIGYGLREGDPIKIVRPAKIIGGNASGNQAHVEWRSGKLQANWARVTYLDDAATSALGDYNWPANCNFCIYQTATVQPDFANSWLTNFDFAFFATAATDTWGIGFLNHNTATSGYASGRVLDASRFTLERGYIHDQAENASGAGVHGIYGLSAISPQMRHIRIERNGDDGTGWQLDPFAGNDRFGYTAEDFLVYELSPSTDNSTQCMEPYVVVRGAGATANEIRQAGAISIRNYIGMGCTQSALELAESLGQTVDGAVIGSEKLYSGLRLGSGLSDAARDLPAGAIATYPNVFKDSVAFVGRGAAAGTNPLWMTAACKDSILTGMETLTSTTSWLNPVSSDGCYFDFGSSITTSQFMTRSSPTRAWLQVPEVSIKNTVMIGDNKRNLCDDFDSSTVSDFSLARAWFGVLNTTMSNGFLNLCTTPTDGSMTVTMNGVTIAATTSSGSLGLGCGDVDGSTCNGTNGGSSVTNTVLESTAALTGDNVFGVNVTPTSLHVALNPDPDENATFRSYMSDGTKSLVSGLARPEYYGLRRLSVSVALLGDGVLSQLENWSTRNLIPVSQ